ncbi:MAG: polysaccharide pyruvyl transferase family protein [Rhodobacteraceae bacterium]|nr:polysaccharide pyruvyl transferase family protein [Paracoccaceae bacterium]
MTAPRIALVAGQWGQNIGNAFFNLGGRHALEQVFGPGSVGFFQDQPNYRTLHNKHRGNPGTHAELIADLDIDALVLQGPVLNAWFRKSWEQAFAILRDRGVRIILHSAAFFKFRPDEFAAVRDFVSEFPPALISTRDSRSCAVLRDWLPGVPIYDGIDAGFFLPDCLQPFELGQNSDYIVCNFDRYPEPDILPAVPGDPAAVTIAGRGYLLRVPQRLNRMAKASKIQAYLGDLTDRRRLPASLDGLRILRPEHRFFPHMTHKIYRHPGAIVSDEPWSYATVYAHSGMTLSDRVHACVATLAYGNPAMLFTPSPRAALFERLGLAQIRDRPVRLCPDRLSAAKAAQIDWMRAHV